MDTNAQNQQSGTVVAGDSNSPLTQPTQTVPHPLQTGSRHKEMGPVGQAAPSESVPLHMSEAAPQLSSEVAEAGVEVSPQVEVPKIPEEAKKSGVTHAPVTAKVVKKPLPTTFSSTSNLPMTQEEAVADTKKFKINRSIRWLAELIKKQYLELLLKK